MLNLSVTHLFSTYWYPDALIHRVTDSLAMQSLLLESGSMTKRLKSFCPRLKIVILNEGFGIPTVVEAQTLGITINQTCWIREVKLCCDEEVLLHARTVIPNCCHRNAWGKIMRIGNKPLGEILFKMKQLHRSPFQYARMKSPNFSQETKTVFLSRRSLYWQHKQPLLLTEYFSEAYAKLS